MIRGLFAKWKQPIYYDFDVTMTDVLLKSIISAVESSNIHAVSYTHLDVYKRQYLGYFK